MNKSTDFPYLSLPGVKHSSNPESDIITWSNKDIPTNWSIPFFHFVFWLISIFASGRITYALISGELNGVGFLDRLAPLFFFIAIWGLVIYLSIAIWRGLRDSESIIISNTAIVISRSGYEKQFEKAKISKLLFGHVDMGDDGYVANALYIICRGNIENPEEIAAWMRVKEKRQLFFLIQQILKEREWDIQYELQKPPQIIDAWSK